MILMRVRLLEHQYSNAALSMATTYAELWFTTEGRVTYLQPRNLALRALITKIVDIRGFAESNSKEFATVIQGQHCNEQPEI